MKALILAIALSMALPSLAIADPRSKANNGTGFKPVSRSAVEGGKKPYHGNFKTMKYHNEFCDHYNCKTCTTIFKTKAGAEKAGYTPCGKCGG